MTPPKTHIHLNALPLCALGNRLLGGACSKDRDDNSRGSEMLHSSSQTQVTAVA